MKNSRLWVPLMLLLAASFSQAQYKNIDPALLGKHISYLASDKLEGRYPGTQGDKLAADYIRNYFRSLRLALPFDKGLQHFSVVTGVELLQGNLVEVNNKSFTVNKDFVPLSFSSNASVEAPVTFAGYGIVAQGLWDDYEGLNVTNQWVMMLAGDPEPDNPQSRLIAFSGDRLKAIHAKDRGAAGMLLVRGESLEKEDKLMPAFYDKTASDSGIPVIHITRALANEILAGAGASIESIEKKILANKSPSGFGTSAVLKAAVKIGLKNVNTQNVVSILPGSDPILKNEYLVIGAHFDHLGWGGKGSGSRMPDTTAIHYGADDNASGVAGILELARVLRNGKPIGRSIIFVAFGAEEMGVVGAKYFVDNPPVPIAKIKAMINLDMIGRLKPDASLNIGGTGTAAEMEALLNQVEADHTLVINRQPDGYGPSDHASFYAAGIPVLFFSTGAHDDYHTPGDSFNKIDLKGQTKVLSWVYDIASRMATFNQPLTFTESGTMARRGQGRGYKVTLGLIPDVASSRQGLGVDGVRKDGPAARAGIRKGDVIVAINGLSVSNVYEYMARLNTLVAGEIVSVEVMRDGRKEILLVQL